jgi:hypothetical protein
MKRIAILVAAAAVFGLEPFARTLGPVVGSAALVVAGILLAFAASGSATAIAATAGALGAFAAGLLVDGSTAIAGAALVGMAYAERTLRVRGTAARGAHVGLALVAGALAGAVSGHYAEADLAVRAVVLVVAAVLVALPQLVEADDPLAHGLEELARELPDPIAATLREGAALRRTVERGLLDRDSEKNANQTWRALLDLAQSRVRLTRKPKSTLHGAAVRARLDDRITAHVSALARIYTAADEAKAAEVSLDDGPLRQVENSGESLEQMSKAIVEEIA